MIIKSRVDRSAEETFDAAFRRFETGYRMLDAKQDCGCYDNLDEMFGKLELDLKARSKGNFPVPTQLPSFILIYYYYYYYHYYYYYYNYHIIIRVVVGIFIFKKDGVSKICMHRIQLDLNQKRSA